MDIERIADELDEVAPTGAVEDIVAILDENFTQDTVARLTETARKRDEAVMCLRLIAGLNPKFREKAEKTIKLLSKIPFPPESGH